MPVRWCVAANQRKLPTVDTPVCGHTNVQTCSPCRRPARCTLMNKILICPLLVEPLGGSDNEAASLTAKSAPNVCVCVPCGQARTSTFGFCRLSLINWVVSRIIAASERQSPRSCHTRNTRGSMDAIGRSQYAAISCISPVSSLSAADIPQILHFDQSIGDNVCA